jgi:hypothetical protein
MMDEALARYRLLTHPHLTPMSGHARQRGLLIVTYTLAACAIGISADRFEVIWPAPLKKIEETLRRAAECEEGGRQTLLDVERMDDGPRVFEVLGMPPRISVWLLEDEVLDQLGVPPSTDHPGANDAADKWAALLDDMATTVPASVFFVDRPMSEMARLVALTIYQMEVFGVTHGRCLLRMRRAGLAAQMGSHAAGGSGRRSRVTP